MRRQRIELWISLGVVLCGIPSAASAQPNTLPADAQEQIHPEAEVFIPAEPRQEADEDRVLSAAMFSQGRLLFQRELPEDALRYYQRAYRFSNGSQTILGEIVPLAFRLGHFDEAARYALLADPKTTLDPFVIRRLALHLTDNQQFEQAVRLYERMHAGIDAEKTPSEAAIITQFEMGRLYFLSQQFEKAAAAFEGLLPVLDDDADAAESQITQALLQDAPLTFAVMGEAFLRGGRPEQAAVMFTRAYPSEEQKTLRSFHLARIAEQAKQPEQVLEQLEVYFESPDRATGVTPFRLLQTALESLRRSDELLPRLEELLKTDPENSSLIFFLAQSELQAGSLDQATMRFEQLRTSQPSVDADRGLIQIALQRENPELLLQRLGEAVMRSGDLTALTDVLHPIPQNPTLWPVLMQRVRDQLAAADPQLMPRALAIAQLALIAEQFEVADEFYAMAAGKPPEIDPDIGTRWALDMLQAERNDRATQLLQSLITLPLPDEELGELYFYLSGALTLQEQFTEAFDAAQQAAKRLPDIPSVELRPAWVLYLAKKWPESETAYRQFLERFGSDYRSQVIRNAVREAKSSLSNLCVFQERHEEAEEWLQQILDEFPENAGAMNDLGYLWADRRSHLHRALRMTRHAVEAEPENYAYRDSYGWALFQLGHYPEAITELQKACQTEEPDGIILDHLGDAQQRAGDLEGAREAWQRALQNLESDDPSRQQIIRSKLEQLRVE